MHQLQAIHVRKPQRDGDKVERLHGQPLLRLGARRACAYLHTVQTVEQDAGDQLARHARSIDHQHPPGRATRHVPATHPQVCRSPRPHVPGAVFGSPPYDAIMP